MMSVAVRDAERSADENKGTVFGCIATLGCEFSIGHDKLLGITKNLGGEAEVIMKQNA